MESQTKRKVIKHSSVILESVECPQATYLHISSLRTFYRKAIEKIISDFLIFCY